MTHYHYLFGPVPSRRYGRSLGVDLCAPKSCTLDCRFCQLGATPTTTLTRNDNPPIAAILGELRNWLAQAAASRADPQRTAIAEPDFITAAGSGEPTLHLHLADLFNFIRNESASRSLLLTNGSLLWLPEVRQAAALADVVKISLHAWDQNSFEHITRPHPSLRLDTILDGYRAFRHEYNGHLNLEVFIIPGVNDSDQAISKIAQLAASFTPDSVNLNTAVRPPADTSIKACTPQRLHELTRFFGAAGQAGELVVPRTRETLTAATICAIVKRHPMSLRDLAQTFNRSEAELLAFITPLLQSGQIAAFDSNGTTSFGNTRES